MSARRGPRMPVAPPPRRVSRILGVVAGALAVATAAACSSTPATNTSPTNKLEVVSWWTSGSEAAALNVLFDDYKKAHSGVTVENATVAGGGGSNVQVVLASRLRGNDPPDVWQTFVGASLKEYVKRGLVNEVTSVYQTDALASVFPKVIMDAVTVDGKQYGVPTGSHRSNVLFYNTKLLAKAGVTEPTSATTIGQLLTDLAALKKAGVTPLCLGGKDTFATAELFENTLLGVVGPAGWANITADRFAWNGTDAKTALRQFGQLLDYADPASGGLTWDQATKKLAQGQCAVLSFNDSAYGELVTDGATEGTDFGAIAFPGTDASYLAVVDTFVAGNGAKNGKNALDFLTVIGTATTEAAFNKVKGSAPLRTDVDVSGLSPYEQSAAKSLRQGKVLLSIVHGEAMSPSFQQGFYDAVSAFVDGRDARAFADTLAKAVNTAAQVPAVP